MENKTIHETVEWLNEAREKGICPFCGDKEEGFHIQKYHRDELLEMVKI